jgi:ankyrin repeat protein
MDIDGRSVLSFVAGNGWEDEVKLLLARHDIEVNSEDDYGRTPLSFAARNGHDGVAKLFLARHDVDVDPF